MKLASFPRWWPFPSGLQANATLMYLKINSNESQLCLVVLHICGGRVELEVALDHFIDCCKEILLGRNLPPRTNGKHASLCRNTP